MTQPHSDYDQLHLSSTQNNKKHITNEVKNLGSKQEMSLQSHHEPASILRLES